MERETIGFRRPQCFAQQPRRSVILAQLTERFAAKSLETQTGAWECLVALAERVFEDTYRGLVVAPARGIPRA